MSSISPVGGVYVLAFEARRFHEGTLTDFNFRLELPKSLELLESRALGAEVSEQDVERDGVPFTRHTMRLSTERFRAHEWPYFVVAAAPDAVPGDLGHAHYSYDFLLDGVRFPLGR